MGYILLLKVLQIESFGPGPGQACDEVGTGRMEMSGSTSPRMSASELAAVLGTEAQPFVLDVREQDEFDAWSIPGAYLIPLGELGARLAEIPTDQQILTVCAAGARSAAAADALRGAGFNVKDLAGGMGSWATVYDAVTIELSRATVVQVRRRSKGCLSYLIGAGDSAIVIDPSTDVERYVEIAEQFGWKISVVMDTHLHADHLSGARKLAKLTGADLKLNPLDTFDFDYVPLQDNEVIALSGGAEITVHALSTPGHTMGSTVYTIDGEAVITGDTLFIDGVGRPDLAERAAEFASNLFDSLHNRVLVLDPSALILPAHYGMEQIVLPDQPVTATIGKVKSDLEPLKLSKDDFIGWAAARATERPPNYAEIIRANMGRSSQSLDFLSMLEVGPNRCSA